jgi:hypothetical protein
MNNRRGKQVIMEGALLTEMYRRRYGEIKIGMLVQVRDRVGVLERKPVEGAVGVPHHPTGSPAAIWRVLPSMLLRHVPKVMLTVGDQVHEVRCLEFFYLKIFWFLLAFVCR